MEEKQEECITRSIRARESTFETFKEMAKSFDSQADLLDEIINFYAIKSLNAGRETEVSNFEAHLKAILEMYAYSLNLASDAELRISAQYIKQLESKDSTIHDLQQKNVLLETKINDLKNEQRDVRERIVILEDDINTFEKKERQLVAQLADKDKLIVSLEEKVAATNASIAVLVQEAEMQKAALAELTAIQNECIQLQTELDKIKKQKEETEYNYKHQIEDLKNKHQNESAEMQRNYENALQQAEVRQEKALLEMQSNAYEESKRYLEEMTVLREEIMRLKISAATAMETAKV